MNLFGRLELRAATDAVMAEGSSASDLVGHQLTLQLFLLRLCVHMRTILRLTFFGNRARSPIVSPSSIP